jgi:hypothetical protein
VKFATRIGHGDVAPCALQFDQLFGAAHRRDLRQRIAGLKARQDLDFFGALGVAQRQFQQEAIELRLRQRKGAFEFDRVLRRDDEERRRQRQGVAVDRNLALLHALDVVTSDVRRE